MLEMLSYNPLLIVAGIIISLEVFVLMTMLMVYMCSFAFLTVIEDPNGHYANAKATAKNSVHLARTKGGDVRGTMVQVKSSIARSASSFDYTKAASSAGNGIYRMLKDAQPQAKALASRVRMEMPTMGMRIISQKEIVHQVISVEKDESDVKHDPYKDIFIPAAPNRKPSVYPGSRIKETIES